MAHAAVVKNADVMYIRDITGISMYHDIRSKPPPGFAAT